MRLSLRLQLLLALVLPAGIILFFVVYRAVGLTQQALERALEHELISVAQAATPLIPPYITALELGDEPTRTHQNTLAKLQQLQDAVGARRIVVVRSLDDKTLVDTQEDSPVGSPYLRAQIDQIEIARVKLGHSTASILFKGPADEWFKTGYAPMSINGEIVAYIATLAPITYGAALDILRHRLTIISAGALLLMTLAALVLANGITSPLGRLSHAAESIGRGALDTPIPRGGPTEAWVLANTMTQMTNSLKARDEHMQMMLAGIAHEVRNPLGGIELFGGLLKEDLEGDPRQSSVNKILNELDILARVVNDFLDYARTPPFAPKRISINQLIEDVVDVCLAIQPDKEVKIKTYGQSITAVVDKPILHGALLNIVQNAVQASPERGEVHVSIQLYPNELCLQVDDAGPGVPPEQREKIFHPFFTTKQKGTGLGLALAHKAALEHQGQLRIEASPLGGARFVLALGPQNSWQKS